MTAIFCAFAGLLVLISIKSFIEGASYLRFFREKIAEPRSNYTPFASVIVPCRGLDQGLEENLRPLLAFDYPEYEVMFVVDDEADPAAEVIGRIIESRVSRKPEVRLIVAPKAIDSGQKVENLREAVLHLSPDSRVLVFADSDARPNANWLSALVAPLADDEAGAATGYRWFLAPEPSFGSELRSAWNASIASALGPKTGSNFCWGGATAIRRDTFEGLQIRDRWSGTLSDDFVVTRTMNEAGLQIVFVPQAVTASVENCTVGDMLTFTTRQMQVTRVYAPRLWALSLAGSGLYVLTMTIAVLIAAAGFPSGLAVVAAISAIIIVLASGIGKAWLRLAAIRLALPAYVRALGRQTVPQLMLWTLTPFVFLLNSIIAGVSRRMRWRGITYELKSPTETVIIAD